MLTKAINATYVRKALADGFTHVVARDRDNGRIEALSLHHDYDTARKALIAGPGNVIYALADLKRTPPRK